MEVMKVDYEMEAFTGENVELLLSKFGFNLDNYFIAMTKPSLLSATLVGNIANFSKKIDIDKSNYENIMRATQKKIMS